MFIAEKVCVGKAQMREEPTPVGTRWLSHISFSWPHHLLCPQHLSVTAISSVIFSHQMVFSASEISLTSILVASELGSQHLVTWMLQWHLCSSYLPSKHYYWILSSTNSKIATGEDWVRDGQNGWRGVEDTGFQLWDKEIMGIKGTA